VYIYVCIYIYIIWILISKYLVNKAIQLRIIYGKVFNII